MTNVSTATRRIRNRVGSSYLTRGGDNHDHRGLNKARRALSIALIEEQLQDAAHEERENWLEYCDRMDRMESDYECPYYYSEEDWDYNNSEIDLEIRDDFEIDFANFERELSEL